MPDQGSVAAPSDDVLVLNRYSEEDVGGHLAGEDEETARRLGWWPQSSTPETVLRAFGEWAEQWRTNGPTRTFAARDKRLGRLVGGCQLRIKSDGSAQVSYWTSATERGKGYATRSLKLLCEYAGSIGVPLLEIEIAEDNLASRMVAERAGFSFVDAFREGECRMTRFHLPLK